MFERCESDCFFACSILHNFSVHVPSCHHTFQLSIHNSPTFISPNPYLSFHTFPSDHSQLITPVLVDFQIRHNTQPIQPSLVHQSLTNPNFSHRLTGIKWHKTLSSPKKSPTVMQHACDTPASKSKWTVQPIFRPVNLARTKFPSLPQRPELLSLANVPPDLKMAIRVFTTNKKRSSRLSEESQDHPRLRQENRSTRNLQ